ncbi:MAG: secretin N-terminal domain-containing protein [Gammaproteobacteria bacterium]
MTKQSKKNIFKTISILVLAIGLIACHNTLYDVSKSNTANMKNQIEASEQQQYPRPPSVIEENQPYVDVTPVSLNRPPAWYNNRVSLHGVNLPFNFYVNQAVSGTGMLINYDDSVKQNQLVSVDYTGNAKGALNYLANKANYFYQYDRANNQLNWSTLETKIFDVSFMPGSSQYQLGQAASSTALSSGGGSSSSGSSSGGGSGAGGGGGYNFSQDTQYSNLTGTLSVWQDLTTTINNLLSKDGTATVSQSTTTVTVHDHPENVQSIGDYIYRMNTEMSRQVRIHVQVLAVQLSKNYNLGINWTLVKQAGANKYTISGNQASNADNTGSFSPVGIAWAVGTGSSLNGTDMLIQALQQQGDVSKITEPTVTTLNNQVATIALQEQQGYISGYSGGTISDGVASIPTPTVSTLVTGFNLYLLPKIQGQNVYLQISTVLSDLISLVTYNASTGETSGGSGSGASGGSSTSGSSTTSGTTSSTTSSTSSSGTVISTPQNVQEPLVDLRSFNQRTMIPNGATLILAGFKENANTANRSKFLNSTLLGGSGAETNTTEVIVLITPVILSNTGNTLYNNTGVE